MLVEWREIPGFPGYDVSSTGEVRSWRSHGPGLHPRKVPKARAPTLSANGYLSVNLGRGQGRTKTMHVHRLVLEAFVGPPPAGCWASHLNGVRTDNRLTNLCWESVADNSRRRHDHGTATPRGMHGQFVAKEAPPCP